MKAIILKIGGGSLVDAKSIMHIPKILEMYSGQGIYLFLVISAFGKTTNKLEVIAKDFVDHTYAEDIGNDIDRLVSFHRNIADQIFPSGDSIFEKIENILAKDLREIGYGLRDILKRDVLRDQIVSLGEMVAVEIVSQYLLSVRKANKIMFSPSFIRTDTSFGNARVDEKETFSSMAFLNIESLLDFNLAIVPGFIGGTNIESFYSYGLKLNFRTTLGREGSDYTAAILAKMINPELKVEKVILFKNVAGIMDKDPNVPGGEDAKPVGNLSFTRCRELLQGTARGVIHPKTIDLLESARIPLRVLSFSNPELPGTLIS